MDLEKIFKKKKILITGHTGFKGSWLTLFLLKYNANILGISDKLLKYPNNFETIKKNKNLKNIFLILKKINKKKNKFI